MGVVGGKGVWRVGLVGVGMKVRGVGLIRGGGLGEEGEEGEGEGGEVWVGGGVNERSEGEMDGVVGEVWGGVMKMKGEEG